jgi:hypothetical protein
VIKSRRIRWARNVACMRINANKILIRKPVGKRPLGRPRHRWEDNLKWILTGFIWLRIRSSGRLL